MTGDAAAATAGAGAGAAALFRGAALIAKTPKLWPYVIAPMLIAALALGLGIWGAIELVGYLAESYLKGWDSGIWAWLRPLVVYPAYAVGIVTAIVGAQIVILPIAAGPFNEMLSEQVEAHVTGRPPPDQTFGQMLRNALPAAWRSLTTVAFNLAVMIVCWPITLIPVVGVLLYLLPTSYVKALESLDVTFGRKRMALSAKRAWIAQRRATALGFGAAIVLGNFIVPIIGTMIVVPAAAAGGTLLVVGEGTS